MELLKIINGCIEMEQAVASVYGIFMQLFPDEKPFWEDLFNDELQHQALLSDPVNIQLIDLLPTEDILPKMEFIQNSLVFANNTIRQIKSGTVTLEKALKTALRLEESMVEIFANEFTANLLATDYRTLTEKILMAERIHIDKIEDMLIKKGFMQLS
ncbi:MAG: hypothetical protein C4538_02615 [Nitrospiraceae bacterium]|nr:MAG: hypothetical protein C4538_02615 [Nitrospiraceae bacterium]